MSEQTLHWNHTIKYYQYCTYNLRHCDFVQLQGFRGLLGGDDSGELLWVNKGKHCDSSDISQLFMTNNFLESKCLNQCITKSGLLLTSTVHWLNQNPAVDTIQTSSWHTYPLTVIPPCAWVLMALACKGTAIGKPPEARACWRSKRKKSTTAVRRRESSTMQVFIPWQGVISLLP